MKDGCPTVNVHQLTNPLPQKTHLRTLSALHPHTHNGRNAKVDASIRVNSAEIRRSVVVSLGNRGTKAQCEESPVQLSQERCVPAVPHDMPFSGSRP